MNDAYAIEIAKNLAHIAKALDEIKSLLLNMVQAQAVQTRRVPPRR